MSGVLWPVDAVAGSPTYTAGQARAAMGALLAGATSARPLGGRSGVSAGIPSNTVTVSGSTVTVKPHNGVIDAETSATAGVYWFAFTANQPITLAAANATNPRIDLIYVQVSDPAQSDGTSTPGVIVDKVTGTASATPAVPAVPARAMPLAQVTVPSSASGFSPTVAWVAPVTSAAGGVALPSGAGVMPAGTFLNEHGEHPFLGSARWDGTQWVPTKLQWQYKKSTFPNSGGDSAFHAFVMETKIIDSGNSTGTDWGLTSGGFSVPYTRTYRVAGSCGWQPDTGSRAAVIAVNGSLVTESEQFLPSNGASHITLLATRPVLIACNVGDLITLQGYHDLSHTVTLAASSLTVELA